MNNNRDSQFINDVENRRSSTTASSSFPSVDNPTHPTHPPPPPQQGQGPPGEPNFSDGSEALFSMYLRRTWEKDSRMAESWKGYADGMLTFVSLGSPSHSSHII